MKYQPYLHPSKQQQTSSSSILNTRSSKATFFLHSSFLLLLLFLLQASTIVVQAKSWNIGKECTADKYRLIYDKPLSCYNNGKCRFGAKDYSTLFPQLTSPNDIPLLEHSTDLTDSKNGVGMYCDCNEKWNDVDGEQISGYTGLYCEALYEICPDDQTICFHGGSCKRTTKDDDSTADYKCDCSSTIQQAGYYAIGKYCQWKITDWCDVDTGYDVSMYGQWYCVNDGVCRDSVDDM